MTLGTKPLLVVAMVFNAAAAVLDLVVYLSPVGHWWSLAFAFCNGTAAVVCTMVYLRLKDLSGRSMRLPPT